MSDKPEMVTIHVYDVNSDEILARQVTRERFEELVNAGVIERKAGAVLASSIRVPEMTVCNVSDGGSGTITKRIPAGRFEELRRLGLPEAEWRAIVLKEGVD